MVGRMMNIDSPNSVLRVRSSTVHWQAEPRHIPDSSASTRFHGEAARCMTGRKTPIGSKPRQTVAGLRHGVMSAAVAFARNRAHDWIVRTSLSSTFSPARIATHTWLSWVFRVTLLVGCAIAAGGAYWTANPGTLVELDPALNRLLRGMALIKSLALIVAVAAVWWRLGRPTRTMIVSAYLVTLWSMTCATVLIWRVTQIPIAAVTFHLALFIFLIAAWRDDLKLPPSIAKILNGFPT